MRRDHDQRDGCAGEEASAAIMALWPQEAWVGYHSAEGEDEPGH